MILIFILMLINKPLTFLPFLRNSFIFYDIDTNGKYLFFEQKKRRKKKHVRTGSVAFFLISVKEFFLLNNKIDIPN